MNSGGIVGVDLQLHSLKINPIIGDIQHRFYEFCADALAPVIGVNHHAQTGDMAAAWILMDVDAAAAHGTAVNLSRELMSIV
jgi:hypothetical protein